MLFPKVGEYLREMHKVKTSKYSQLFFCVDSSGLVVLVTFRVLVQRILGWNI